MKRAKIIRWLPPSSLLDRLFFKVGINEHVYERETELSRGTCRKSEKDCKSAMLSSSVRCP